jgi:hypothetical protein
MFIWFFRNGYLWYQYIVSKKIASNIGNCHAEKNIFLELSRLTIQHSNIQKLNIIVINNDNLKIDCRNGMFIIYTHKNTKTN